MKINLFTNFLKHELQVTFQEFLRSVLYNQTDSDCSSVILVFDKIIFLNIIFVLKFSSVGSLSPSYIILYIILYINSHLSL